MAAIQRRTKQELMNERFEFKASESFIEDFAGAAVKADLDMSEFARDAIMAATKRVNPGLSIDEQLDISMIGTNQLRLPLIGTSYCGTFQEAVATAESDFVLSEQTRRELGAVEGDVVMRVHGESMIEAGIPDNALLLMEPLRHARMPRNGDIVLVQIVKEDNERYESTVKRYVSGHPLKFLNGKGEPIEMPNDMVAIESLAVAKGIISRL